MRVNTSVALVDGIRRGFGDAHLLQADVMWSEEQLGDSESLVIHAHNLLVAAVYCLLARPCRCSHFAVVAFAKIRKHIVARNMIGCSAQTVIHIVSQLITVGSVGLTWPCASLYRSFGLHNTVDVCIHSSHTSPP